LSSPTFCSVAGSQRYDFRKFTIVITGFNTDIEHDGIVYHVQTEDKGLDSPLILSLVYSGGTILASKRSRYEDLIAAGFDEGVLTERLKRQHRLICAAINSGRLEELKRMSARDHEGTTGDATETASPVIQASEVSEFELTPPTQVPHIVTTAESKVASSPFEEAPCVSEAVVVVEERKERRSRERGPGKDSAYTVYDSRRRSPVNEVVEAETGLALTVLDEEEFRAGESFTIRVLVSDRSGKQEKPLGGVAVSVKLLGSAFRPQTYSVKTERDGIAAVPTTMPKFTSGRAAVVIHAVVKGQTVELRRVIHPV
jgi:hypothetical protein